MKPKKLWLLMISIMFVIISLFTVAYAFNINDALGGARSFEGAAIGFATTTNMDFARELTHALQAIGTVIALCVGIVIAMRIMSDSAASKALAKEALTAYIIGVSVMYGAFGIWSGVVLSMQTITPPASSGTYVEGTLRKLLKRLYEVKPIEHTKVNSAKANVYATSEEIGQGGVWFWSDSGLVSKALGTLLDDGAILGGDSWASLGGWNTNDKDLAKTNAQKLINQDGIHYMGRYVNKHISNEEIDGGSDGGMLFFCIFEVDIGDYNVPYNHVSYATTAYDCSVNLGVPEGAIIYFAIDTDAAGLGHLDRVENYIRTVAKVFEDKGGKYKVGVYGGAQVVAYLYDNASDVCKGFWQCMAWSYGKVFENYTLYQGSCGLPTSAGFDVDRNACPDLKAATMWNRSGLWTKSGL